MIRLRKNATMLLLQLREVFQPARDGVILVHVNKTGGSSIGRALGMPLEHKTALEKIAQLGQKKWDNCYSFAVVRNPWDKVVSHYHYRVQTNQTGLADANIEFKQWVKLCYEQQDPAYYDKPKMFQPQIDWISDQQGNILVNHICRFETLNADFLTLCEAIGRTAELPHIKTSNRGKYCDYYDDETQEIIRKWFVKDIDFFGYKF